VKYKESIKNLFLIDISKNFDLKRKDLAKKKARFLNLAFYKM
jgi:hypothetical protein